MSISKRLVEARGRRIGAYNDNRAGATFIVPLAVGAAPASAPPMGAPRSLSA